MTTAYNDSMIDTGSKNPHTQKPITKFRAVEDYKFMGAVRRNDQMVSYNAFKRRTLKWWKKAFFHLYMLAILNAFILHKKTVVIGNSLTHRLFHRDLAMQLVAWAPIDVPQAFKNVGETVLMRLTARHFPRLVQAKKGAKTRHPQRDCVVCSGSGKRRRSRYECPSCNVGLCTNQCFELFYTKKSVKHHLKRRINNKMPSNP